MKVTKNIALVAHDNCKRDMAEWVEYNYRTLLKHHLVCTGTTGRMVEEAFIKKIEKEEKKPVNYSITFLKSGPLGGDQQLGALIAEGKVDMLIFFWDPMQAQPHDVDVKALLRISAVYNIPTACNRSTADFIISSHLLDEVYEPLLIDYTKYITRAIN